MSHLASVLMLVALILRGALPQGWMPVGDRSSATGTAFVICSVTGPLQLTLDQDGQPVPDSPADDTAHQPCAFASLASLSTPSDGQAIPAPQFHGHASRLPASHPAPDTAAFGPSRARAPPASSALS